MSKSHGIQTEWDRIPTRRELGDFFVPGVEYLWCLFKNQPHAERAEGWVAVEMRLAGSNTARPLPRFQIGGHEVVLLAQGTPIPGASSASCGIPESIDPELAGLLGLGAAEPSKAGAGASDMPTPLTLPSLPPPPRKAAAAGR